MTVILLALATLLASAVESPRVQWLSGFLTGRSVTQPVAPGPPGTAGNENGYRFEDE